MKKSNTSKRRPGFFLLILVFLFQLLFSGCQERIDDADASAEEVPAADGPIEPDGRIEVTDQAGNKVVLERPAEKIVSCYYISTASLLALGCSDRLVGIEMKAESRGLYVQAAPALLELPAVGSGKGINIEAIAALSPDVCILPQKLAEEGKLLEQIGIPVAVVHPESEPEFREELELLGQLTGTEERASSLLERYDSMNAALSEILSDTDKPLVYLASGSDLLTTFPKGIYQHDLIERAGARNAAAGEAGNGGKQTISMETLIGWNPDAIFLVADASYSVEDVLQMPELAGVKAIQKKAVYAFPSELEAWDYPTPSSVLGSWYMAHRLHPQQVDAAAFSEKVSSFYESVFGFTVKDSSMDPKL